MLIKIGENGISELKRLTNKCNKTRWKQKMKFIYSIYVREALIVLFVGLPTKIPICASCTHMCKHCKMESIVF